MQLEERKPHFKCHPYEQFNWIPRFAFSSSSSLQSHIKSNWVIVEKSWMWNITKTLRIMSRMRLHRNVNQVEASVRMKNWNFIKAWPTNQPGATWFIFEAPKKSPFPPPWPMLVKFFRFCKLSKRMHCILWQTMKHSVKHFISAWNKLLWMQLTYSI